jgi:hypothetical protein
LEISADFAMWSISSVLFTWIPLGRFGYSMCGAQMIGAHSTEGGTNPQRVIRAIRKPMCQAVFSPYPYRREREFGSIEGFHLRTERFNPPSGTGLQDGPTRVIFCTKTKGPIVQARSALHRSNLLFVSA